MMDTHTVPIFTLLLFLLTPGEAKVSSCYLCESSSLMPDTACEKGSTSMKKIECKVEGCVSSVTVAGGLATWLRGCCEEGTCLNKHEKKPGGVTIDYVSCYTDDCNTMDPRSGSDLHSPALLMVSFSALLSLWNIKYS